jgi:ClpP class serine protease
VFVPHYAMSGGTLIAMAADEIVMDENAVLGSIDPQIGGYPAVSILHVVATKSLDEIDDQTLVMADIARKAMKQVHATIVDLLRENQVAADEAETIAKELSSGQWTHDFPITVAEARRIGLAVTTEVPREVDEIMSLYPQASRRRPSVTYVPAPYPLPGGESPRRPPAP